MSSILAYGHDVAEGKSTYNLPPWVSYRDWVAHQEALLDGADGAAPVAADAEWDSYLRGDFLQGFEAEVAAAMGKPDSAFVVTGTMAQLCAIQTHHEQLHADEKIIMVHPTSHLLNHEADSFEQLCGFSAVTVGDPSLALSADAVRTGLEQLVAAGRSLPSTLLVEVPQRHNGGRCASVEELTEMRALCDQYGVRFHMDGARFWEARPALGESYAAIAALFDSVYLSFYKGIGAAVGAMLCGEEDFVLDAKVWRHRFGGQLVHSTMITADMAASMRVAEANDSHTKGYQQLVALAEAVQTLAPERLRYDPPVPESALTHVHVRGSLPELTAAGAALEERTGVSLVRRLSSKYDSGEGYSGDGNKGNVRVGHERMAEDEFFYEWKVPKAWLDLPTAELVEAYSTAWREFFELLDSMAAAGAAAAAAAPVEEAGTQAVAAGASAKL
jgi:threonine aldolase